MVLEQVGDEHAAKETVILVVVDWYLGKEGRYLLLDSIWSIPEVAYLPRDQARSTVRIAGALIGRSLTDSVACLLQKLFS